MIMRSTLSGGNSSLFVFNFHPRKCALKQHQHCGAVGWEERWQFNCLRELTTIEKSMRGLLSGGNTSLNIDKC